MTYKTKVSFLVDTLYFDGLEDYYDGEVLVMNVAMYKKREGVDHLCVDDAKRIVEARRPKPTKGYDTHAFLHDHA